MTQENLLLHIGNLWYQIKEYASSLEEKYRFGYQSEECKNNLIQATWFTEEIERYYKGCSCLVEEDICKLIVKTQKLVL
jgi:hypothetical protein